MTEKLDLLLEEQKLNRHELSKRTGIPYMTIVNFYKTGTDNVKRGTLLKLAKYFGVSLDYLAVDEVEERACALPAPEIKMLPRTVKKPRLRPVIQALPLLCDTNVERYDDVPEKLRCDFTLRFPDDSMERLGIVSGDIVYAREQSDVHNHDVAVVAIDGAVTLRRIYRNESRLALLAENPAVAPLVLMGEGGVRILGKAVAYINWNAIV